MTLLVKDALVATQELIDCGAQLNAIRLDGVLPVGMTEADLADIQKRFDKSRVIMQVYAPLEDDAYLYEVTTLWGHSPKLYAEFPYLYARMYPHEVPETQVLMGQLIDYEYCIPSIEDPIERAEAEAAAAKLKLAIDEGLASRPE